MEFEFLKRVFNNIDVGQDLEYFEIATFKELDVARLCAFYKSLESGQNVILIPSNFIHPLFKPLEIKVGNKIKLVDFIQNLVEAQYEKVEQVYDSMQFSQKGDVITIFTNLNSTVYRVEFFDDDIEKISLLDSISLRQFKELKNALLLNIAPTEVDFTPEIYGNFDQTNPKIVIHSNKTFSFSNDQSALNHNELILKSLPLFHKNEQIYTQFISKYIGYDIYYCGHNWEILPSGFKEFSLKDLKLPIPLDKGFIFENKKVILLTDKEIFSTLNLAKSKTKKTSKFKKFFDNEVNVGDFVVHEAHGVGVYLGIETKVVLGEVKDYVIIEYLNSDKLLIPLDQLDRLSKYVSSEGTLPRLTKLGTAEWENIKRKLKKSVEDIAKELLEIYAKKSLEKGIKFDPDNEIQQKFESEFKYTLTEDQARTIFEVKDDMESGRPMDRLVIGDVGFGKTEVAIRAALKAVQSGKQVLVLAPTTVLVSQLYNVFSNRLGKLGAVVARVSRFDGTRKNTESIIRANEGKVDILIGTHRLLSNDVKIPNVGLLIVDEEQRFGVKQKERIRKLRANVDMLSLSATPIPRTLQMALTGIKDISVIATPPTGRLAITNEVIFKEDIAEKILAEYKRKGQVFIVHNKIENMHTFVEELKQELPPKIKIISAHGQMRGDKIEEIMFQFEEKQFDVLIATTIIENGIDIPNVNTIIINDAHNFGLSQLYQLRGRVGRSNIQAYCYLVVPKTREFIQLHKNPTTELRKLHKLLEDHKIEDRWVTPDAVSRIEAILDNQELGAGFKIASRDLEIRGSGNILGSQQSGHINAVGYEMYVRLLEQEIERIRKVEKEVKANEAIEAIEAQINE